MPPRLRFRFFFCKTKPQRIAITAASPRHTAPQPRRGCAVAVGPVGLAAPARQLRNRRKCMAWGTAAIIPPSTCERALMFFYGIMALAIGFGLGFIVAIAAFAPSGKPKKATFDDIFKN